MTAFLMSDEEREESIIERRERERTESGKIDNDELIPLIPNIKGDVRKTLTEIQVIKLDPPGDGYKGNIPLESGMSTVAKLYGNGVYNFHAINQDGKVLRRSTGVKISWIPPENASKPPSNDQASNLLQWQAEQHSRETARVEAFGRMAVESTRETATQHITALATQQTSAVERDRAYFAGLMAQQQQFFQSMMQQSQQMHQQTMERAREDFRQTIQVVQLSHERVAQASDPHLLLNMFKQGLALNASNTEDDEDEPESENPWTEAIRAGASAIKDITDVAKINAITAVKKPVRAALPPKRKGRTPPPAAPLVSPQENVLDSAGPIPPTTPSKREKIFKAGELAEIVRLKRLLDMKGLDFAATVRNASQYIAGADVSTEQDEPADESESESDESEEIDSGEDTAADVDRSESS